MQTDSLPSWFNKIAGDPKTFRQRFIQKFENPNQIKESTLDELIEIFGRINQHQLTHCIHQNLNEKIKIKLKSLIEKFNFILRHALEDLIANRRVNFEKLNTIYQVTNFSTETIEEQSIRDIAQHLLSLPFPTQEAKRSRCYSIPAIKRYVDAQQKELNKTIKIIFQSTVLMLESRQTLSLTLSEEQRLFKYAALKGQGIVISWGHLLFIWASRTEQARQIHQELQMHFHFDKLLLSNTTKLSETGRLTNSSFKEFVFEQTIDFLFCHPNSFLSASHVEVELKEIFSNSLRAQQNAIYFIDYLHSLDVTDGADFPFEEALSLLKGLISQENSPIYSFLHSYLHFFHCLKKLSVDKSFAPFVFDVIHQLNEEEKRRYDHWIYEEFSKRL